MPNSPKEKFPIKKPATWGIATDGRLQLRFGDGYSVARKTGAESVDVWRQIVEAETRARDSGYTMANAVGSVLKTHPALIAYYKLNDIAYAKWMCAPNGDFFLVVDEKLWWFYGQFRHIDLVEEVFRVRASEHVFPVNTFANAQPVPPHLYPILDLSPPGDATNTQRDEPMPGYDEYTKLEERLKKSEEENRLLGKRLIETQTTLEVALGSPATPYEETPPGDPTFSMIKHSAVDAGTMITAVQAQKLFNKAVVKALKKLMPEEHHKFLESDVGADFVNILAPLVVHGLATHGPYLIPQAVAPMAATAAGHALRGQMFVLGVKYTDAVAEIMLSVKDDVAALVALFSAAGNVVETSGTGSTDKIEDNGPAETDLHVVKNKQKQEA